MQVSDDGTSATFPNGLRLRLTPGDVSHQAIYDACVRIIDPVPPRPVVNRDGQVALEENLDDPEYRAALDRAKERRAWAAIKAVTMLGSELEQPPTDTPGPEDINWDKLAAARDIPSPINQYERYELWLRYYGFVRGYPTPADGLGEYVGLCQWLAVKAGITVEAPTAIAATFRDQTGRDTGAAGGTVATDGDGDVGRHAAAGGLGY